MRHFNQGGGQIGRGLEHPRVQSCSSDAPGQFWPQLGIDSSLLGQLETIPSRKHGNGHRAPGIGSVSNYFNGITCQWTAGSQVEPSFLIFWNFNLCPDLGTHQEGVQFRPSDSQHSEGIPSHNAHREPGALSGGWCTWDMSGWYPTCRFIQSGHPHVYSPFKYCRQTLMVVHSGLYALALHVKEIVGAQISPGLSFSPALCRLEDHPSNFHTLLGSFSKSWFSNL